MHDYWKDELRALGKTKDSAAFSAVLDSTLWTGSRYEIRTTSYPLLSRAADHLRRLRERGVEDWKLDAFAELLAPALSTAFLRHTLYRICRRSGLSATEASRRARRLEFDCLSPHWLQVAQASRL